MTETHDALVVIAKGIEAAKSVTRARGGAYTPGDTTIEMAAEQFGVKKGLVGKLRQILHGATPELIEVILQGRISLRQADQLSRDTPEQQKVIAERLLNLPERAFHARNRERIGKPASEIVHSNLNKVMQDALRLTPADLDALTLKLYAEYERRQAAFRRGLGPN